MITVPIFQQLYDAAIAEIQSRNPELTDTSEGSALDAIAGGGAVLSQDVIRSALDRFSELFFSTATGAALDALALDRLNLLRKPAVAAIGELTWTRGAAVGGYTVPAGTQFQATVGTEVVTFVSTADVTLLAVDTTATIPCEAIETGLVGNVAIGVVTEIVPPLPVDADATVTNPARFAGGAEAETDELFRARIKRYYASLRRGTNEALETAALGVPGVAHAAIDERDLQLSGFTWLFISDTSGGSNAALEALVRNVIEAWRAAGCQIVVNGAVPQVVALSVELAIRQGANRDTIRTACRAAIVNYGLTLAPSQVARLSQIEKACIDAGGGLVFGAQVTSHTGPISPATPNRAIRFEATSTTFTFIETVR